MFLLRSWILVCAVLTAGGWLASAFHALNRSSYLALGLAAAGLCWLARGAGRPVSISAGKLRRRFARPLPALYLVLALLAIGGGLLYAPTNIDGLSYRYPRILHWLSEQRWHWIHSADIRLNVVATGFDWLSAPILLFTKCDRMITGLNAVSFFLLPGACFMALHQLGVRKRVAAKWMWVMPAGFCYFMQAGSVANDMYAAIFTLSAIGLALRARAERTVADLGISLLALALASNAKQTNLPFALPWLIAVAPVLPLARRHPAASLGVVLLAAGCSILPNSIMNVAHGFPWQGFIPGRDATPQSPFFGVAGNLFWVTFSNLQPPIIPWTGKWNELRLHFLASPWGGPFRSFEAFGYLHRAASEQFSGLGCFVTLLLAVSWLAAWGRRAGGWNARRWIRASLWFGFLIFLAKVGINQNPRYLAPWYPVLSASFLLGAGQAALIRGRWWNRAARAVLALAILLTIFSRQRPLFPAGTLVEIARQHFGANSGFQKVLNSYAFAETVRTELDPFLKTIPPGEKLLGYAARFGEKEPFFWKPYFERKVQRVFNSDPPEALREWGLRYLVVSSGVLNTNQDPILVHEPPSPRSNLSSIEEWTSAYKAELVSSASYLVGPEGPVEKLYLVKLK